MASPREDLPTLFGNSNSQPMFSTGGARCAAKWARALGSGSRTRLVWAIRGGVTRFGDRVVGSGDDCRCIHVVLFRAHMIGGPARAAWSVAA